MKDFIHHAFSISECAKELAEFETLPASKAELKERGEILPFFEKNLHLAAFLGTYIPDIANPDRIANEYDIFGDFACDLAVGDSKSKTFLLVEFEDAKSESLFVKKGTKSTPEWAPRFEHGFSQVLDWFWKLSDMEKSDDYENRFGARHVKIRGIRGTQYLIIVYAMHTYRTRGIRGTQYLIIVYAMHTYRTVSNDTDNRVPCLCAEKI